jgi:hypothetical protein
VKKAIAGFLFRQRVFAEPGQRESAGAKPRAFMATARGPVLENCAMVLLASRTSSVAVFTSPPLDVSLECTE